MSHLIRLYIISLLVRPIMMLSLLNLEFYGARKYSKCERIVLAKFLEIISAFVIFFFNFNNNPTEKKRQPTSGLLLCWRDAITMSIGALSAFVRGDANTFGNCVIFKISNSFGFSCRARRFSNASTAASRGRWLPFCLRVLQKFRVSK